MSTSPSTPADSLVEVARRIIAAREAEVRHYALIYPLLLGEIPEIMDAWDRSTEELPWSRLEASSKQNNLVSVITRVIDCAMGSASREERVNALVQAASNHGGSRRKQNVGIDIIFAEYDKLRTATWRQLKDLGEGRTSLDAIFVIDGLLSIASRATALGYHREEMEPTGHYDKEIQELKKTVRS